jgi:hypothetical protein
MKYTVVMGTLSFIKIGAIQELIERDTQTAWRLHERTFIFSK